MEKKPTNPISPLKHPKHPRGLGKGLSALLGNEASAATEFSNQLSPQQQGQKQGQTILSLPIAKIHASPNQPRKQFNEQEISELAQSFAQNGVLQPILVVSMDHGDYRIVAGERRWRAAQKAGLHELPCIIKELDEEKILQVSLIENLQRQDLNPIEEALAYQQLLSEYNYRQEDIADFVNKSRSHVANTLRLLKLPEGVIDYVRSGQLSAGHARGLVNHPEADTLATQIVKAGLSVRQAENLAKNRSDESNPGRSVSSLNNTNSGLRYIEKELSDMFGLATNVVQRKNHYVVSFKVGNSGEFDDFLKMLRTVFAHQ